MCNTNGVSIVWNEHVFFHQFLLPQYKIVPVHVLGNRDQRIKRMMYYHLRASFLVAIFYITIKYEIWASREID